jgi:hypothetical protein
MLETLGWSPAPKKLKKKKKEYENKKEIHTKGPNTTSCKSCSTS